MDNPELNCPKSNTREKKKTTAQPKLTKMLINNTCADAALIPTILKMSQLYATKTAVPNKTTINLAHNISGKKTSCFFDRSSNLQVGKLYKHR